MTSAGDELLAGENRLKVLLGCTKGIVFELDRDSRYVGVWTHDDGLLAAPRQALVGKTIGEVLGPEFGATFAGMIQRIYDTGKPETLEYELEVQGGGQRWFVADLMESPPMAGRDRTVVCLVRDITAHKQLEDQLRQAQKLEAIGRLAGGIAHDFNNILTTIIGYSEMLLGELESSTPRHTHAKRIRHAAGRASALTNQLLAYGRRQVLLPEDLDVNAVITTMADMLRRLIGENVELRLELDPKVGGAKVDRSGLEQVIMNLSINARDAVGVSGGVLTLRTEAVELDPAYCATREIVPGRYVKIVAADNGEGMDEATQARVFEPFFTTKELGKGTGLGLSTVYGIVKQSTGHIEVESAPDEGSRFSVYLPHVEIAPQAVTPAEPSYSRRAKGMTVLVAEDDVNVRTLIHRYLTRSGYEVVLASSGDEAFGLANDHAIDLLVTDIVMPKMGGDVLARKLRDALPELRILYISGYPDDEGQPRVPRVDNSLFLRKPFTRQDLIAQVETLLDPAPRPRVAG
jgi:two-component system cell cycle sensor histidine kinase/response regulator CckA